MLRLTAELVEYEDARRGQCVYLNAEPDVVQLGKLVKQADRTHRVHEERKICSISYMHVQRQANCRDTDTNTTQHSSAYTTATPDVAYKYQWVKVERRGAWTGKRYIYKHEGGLQLKTWTSKRGGTIWHRTINLTVGYETCGLVRGCGTGNNSGEDRVG